MTPYKPGSIARPGRRLVNVDVDTESIDESPPAPVADNRFVSLEIVDDDGSGGDPYNHTGSHCVVTIDDD